jgi:hypothetical protein
MAASVSLRRGCERKRPGRPRWGLGQLFAALSLLVQIIAAPVLHQPAPVGFAGTGSFPVVFDEHALCLSGDPAASESPTDQSPKPARHHFAFCCLCHGNAALGLAPQVRFEPVPFARSDRIFPPSEEAPARRLSGTVGARAPPIRV